MFISLNVLIEESWISTCPSTLEQEHFPALSIISSKLCFWYWITSLSRSAYIQVDGQEIILLCLLQCLCELLLRLMLQGQLSPSERSHSFKQRQHSRFNSCFSCLFGAGAELILFPDCWLEVWHRACGPFPRPVQVSAPPAAHTAEAPASHPPVLHPACGPDLRTTTLLLRSSFRSATVPPRTDIPCKLCRTPRAFHTWILPAPLFLFLWERERERERDRDRQTEREMRERERERGIDVREKHQSVASCTCPDWGSNPQPR